MKFLSNIDLQKNQLISAVIQNLTGDPSNPVVGQIYFNTQTAVLKIYRKIGEGAAFWDTVGVTNLSVGTVTAVKVPIVSSAGDGIDTLPAATGTEAGILTAEAQTIGGAKTFQNGVITGSGTQTWQIESGESLLFRSGSTPLTKMSIDTDGVIVANGFTGNGANLADLNASAVTTGTLAIARGGTGLTAYTKGDILYSDATNSLDKLGIGATGTVLRVSSGGIPEWATGGSVDNAFVIKFDGATTVEGTNIYTFDGSAAKTIDFKGGNLITIDKAAGAVTFKHDALSTVYTTGANTSQTLTDIELLSGLTVDDSGHVSAGTFRKLVAGSDLTITPENDGNITIAHEAFTTTANISEETATFGGTFTAIDTITRDNGHVTVVNTKTVTLPTETQLSITEGSGVFFDENPSVSNHAITFSRSNQTANAIIVGELTTIKAGAIGNLPIQTGNLTVGGDAVIAGNLTVNGAITTLDTQTVLIKDNIIEINSNQTGVPESSLVSGIEVQRGSQPNFKFVFVEQTDDFRLGKVGGTLQPVLTRDELTNLTDGDILVFDTTNKRAIGKTFDELALPQKFAVTLHDTIASQNATPTSTLDKVTIINETVYVITHGLGTEDVTVSLREVSTGEIVQTIIETVTINTIRITFATAPTQGALRVTVIG